MTTWHGSYYSKDNKPFDLQPPCVKPRGRSYGTTIFKSSKECLGGLVIWELGEGSTGPGSTRKGHEKVIFYIHDFSSTLHITWNMEYSLLTRWDIPFNEVYAHDLVTYWRKQRFRGSKFIQWMFLLQQFRVCVISFTDWIEYTIIINTWHKD